MIGVIVFEHEKATYNFIFYTTEFKERNIISAKVTVCPAVTISYLNH